MENCDHLKEIITTHLEMGEAFLPIDEVIDQVEFKSLGIRMAGLPYSFFELFYHIQFTQKDILNYCLDEKYNPPTWPDSYWPAMKSPEDVNSWKSLRKEYLKTRKKLQDWVLLPETSLDEKVKGQQKRGKNVHTVFRELLLVLEHSAYHTGQLFLLARLLKDNPKESE